MSSYSAEISLTPYLQSAAVQTGAHIVFHCPTHKRERVRLLGGKSSWEEIESPNEIRVDINKYEDGVMLFFEYIFGQLT